MLPLATPFNQYLPFFFDLQTNGDAALQLLVGYLYLVAFKQPIQNLILCTRLSLVFTYPLYNSLLKKRSIYRYVSATIILIKYHRCSALSAVPPSLSLCLVQRPISSSSLMLSNLSTAAHIHRVVACSNM